MITIKKSETADSRSCDPTKVSKEQLTISTAQHINDVRQAMWFFIEMMNKAGKDHDRHKLETMDRFHEVFKGGFEDETWYNEHMKVSPHHMGDPGTVDLAKVTLVDVMEYISDCVMAALGRTGKVTELKIDENVLMQAFKNTAKLLEKNVKVEG